MGGSFRSILDVVRRLLIRRERSVVNVILAMHASLLAYSAALHSPVIDEPAHLAAGLSHWHHGTFSLYRVNPPLVRLVATAPLLLTNIKTDWYRYSEDLAGRPEFPVGDDLIAANGSKIFIYTMLARWACIPFSLVGGVVCYRWARLLFGGGSGLVALILWCFSPTILGHGSLLTPDVAGTSFGLAACFLFACWLVKPGWRLALCCGFLLGLAECCKSTWIILFPLFVVIWGVHPMTTRSKARFMQLAAILLIGWTSLLCVYGFDGVGQPLGSIPVQSRLARRVLCMNDGGDRSVLSPAIAQIPLPLPRDYVAGLDRQWRDLEGPNRSFLRGEWRSEGWWYYYLYGLTIKEPCGALILAGLSLFFLCFAACSGAFRIRTSQTRLRHMRAFALVAICPGVVLVLASMNTGMNHHVRYVMPVVPFVYILAAGLVLRSLPLQRVRTALIGVLVAYVTVSSLLYFPNSLSYFNEFVGGPANGIAHLNNSNIDWGQDLLGLRDWKRRNAPNESLRLAYFGRVNPVFAGIDFQVPPLSIAGEMRRTDLDRLEPGWYAVSVTLLQGREYRVPTPEGKWIACPEGAVSYFARLKPVARIGHSILIYRIEPNANADGG